jgi:hypothetical protein
MGKRPHSVVIPLVVTHTIEQYNGLFTLLDLKRKNLPVLLLGAKYIYPVLNGHGGILGFSQWFERLII